ncbi:arginyltransferase [Algicella marina]|uniref:Aspartate/glutamate leucyltransferase n=1 Tax=Algicella marina TaxID=2683284 RepID=A0A6P1T0J1_9RHOB|nr:arginyltransferase [Algicella marina]QHQ34956.1 arginyltransferase [Algicella marina]
MHHNPPKTPQFYVTAPQPCPYLDGKVERKLFTALHPQSADRLNNALSHQGFRRSQNVVYRPSCSECNACLSARIVVKEFRPSKSQRRTLKRNAHLEREATAPWASEAQYELFKRYLASRHSDGGMADMDVYEYAAMVEETAVRSRLVEYYAATPDGRELVAVCLTDLLSDGLSMVYSFYDPDLYSDSLGTYIILDHVRIAQEAGLDYVYLGYWVQGSRKMAYKARFSPLEVYSRGSWTLLDRAAVDANASHPLDNDPIAEQVAAIHLPDGKI